MIYKRIFVWGLTQPRSDTEHRPPGDSLVVSFPLTPATLLDLVPGEVSLRLEDLDERPA